MEDTIAAVATTIGESSINVIRISGKESINVANKIFSKDISNVPSHTVHYGFIVENNEKIDEVFLSVFRTPKSFTTEDVVEISVHGGSASVNKVMELVLSNGARLAEPGEFLKRAFLNGRIDLTKAEAVQDLINAKSENARKIIMNNLEGKTSSKIKELRQKLRNIISNIEVNIDYPEYLDIEEMTREKIIDNLDYIKENLNSIIENSKNSKVIKDGINVAIIGRPNVGKSSILNKLLKEDKAIVTDVAGTTRDIVEGQAVIDGILLNFIDTAGIRKTDDKVEQIGVTKSLNELSNANLIILVLNNNEPLTEEDKYLLNLTEDKKRIIVVNKNDLENKLQIKEDVITTNTNSYEGIESLINKIKEMFNLDKIDTDDFNYVSNVEQIAKLEEARQSLIDIETSLKNDMPIDIIEIDIKNIWTILGEILGETYTEELLDNLFKDFCVGK